MRALQISRASLTLLGGAFYNSVVHVVAGPDMSEPQTIIDKLWAAHEILRRDDGESLLWVDRHYVHEGSFHAFGKLAARGVKVAEPGLTFGVADHYVPTRGSRTNIANPELARMVRQVEENTAEHGIRLFGIGDPEGQSRLGHLDAAGRQLAEGMERALVHVVPVDPEQRFAVVPPQDLVRGPQLVDDGLRICHSRLPA